MRIPPLSVTALDAAILLALLPGCAQTGTADRDAPPELVDEPGGEVEPDEFSEFDEFEEFGEREEVFDPLSGVNRGIFWFNDGFYMWVLRPTATGYAYVVPEPARVAVDRAYMNLKTPARFANSLLQLKFEKSGVELGRLLANSTIGIGGLFDPADAWFGLPAPSPEDFGQTLGRWGVGEGFPLVVPFLGPSNLRDGFGMIPDAFAQPGAYFVPFWVTAAATAGDRFNSASLHLGEYESFKKDALDPYTFFRDAYHQNREQKLEE